MRRSTILAAVLALLALPARAQLPPAGADSRLFGHLPYPEAPSWELVEAPAGFGVGGRCMVHRDASADLAALLAAADATPGVGAILRGISCFRPIAYQQRVFCRGDAACSGASTRALQVAPPGYSEHATGYAVDFGLRPTPGCQDVEPCFAYTEPGRWLIANAPRFGFELSFPFRNVQGVTWEPWHWRWVGRSPTAPGAARARSLFARARQRFPAVPRVVDPPPPIIAAPPATLPVPAIPAKGKRKRR